MKNFWAKFKKPIYALAPLAGVTDSAFRQICKEQGADVVYSEMASAAALYYLQDKKDNPTLDLLKFDKIERPYVVQLFGSDPRHFEVAAKIVSSHPLSASPSGRGRDFGPDGIDINFGCPVPKVAKQKAGAELFKNKKLSREVIKSVIAKTNLPISIKTRTMAGDVGILEFLDYIKDLDVKAVMIHGRTLKQGFAGEIDAGIIKKARNYFGGIILANGGVDSAEKARQILKETEADGLGVGRGALGRPWIFNQLRTGNYELKIEEKIKIILKHAKLAKKLKGEQGIIEMRKHLCWYVQGFSGAKKFREKLVKVNNINEIKNILAPLKQGGKSYEYQD